MNWGIRAFSIYTEGMKTLILLLASVVLAQGSIIPYLNDVTFNGVDYSWTYNMVLSGDQNFRNSSTGDFTEIVDFRGLGTTSWLGGALAPGDVIIDLQLTGPGSLPPGAVDLGVLWNVVVRNDSAAVNGAGVDVLLGQLVLTSTLYRQTTGAFSSQGQKVADLTTTFNQGYVPVPGRDGSRVPEPRAGWMLGAGVGLVAIGRRWLTNS